MRRSRRLDFRLEPFPVRCYTSSARDTPVAVTGCGSSRAPKWTAMGVVSLASAVSCHEGAFSYGANSYLRGRIMFWRKKRISFRDLVTTIVLGDSIMSPRLFIGLYEAKALAVETMKVGVAVGAQFPLKVFPIIKQVEGKNAQSTYAFVEKGVREWMQLNADSDLAIEATRPIAMTMAIFEHESIDRITRHKELIGWIEGTFNSGLLMGVTYPSRSLKVLEASVSADYESLLPAKDTVSDHWTPAPAQNVQQFLAIVRDMVVRYEKDQGTLR